MFLGLAGYFSLQVLSRVLVSDSAEMDEAEQFVLAQRWAWGYHSQPPLYTWLQLLVFGIVGQNILGLALLKNLLLFGTFVFTYLSAKEVIEEEVPALLGALSLMLLPQVLWESQRDLTHTVLATTCAAASLYSALRFFKTGAAGWAALLGVCAGAGMLGKYNFAFFLVGLLVAALSLKTLRNRLFSLKMILCLGVLALVIAPHAYWFTHHSAPAWQRFQAVRIDQTGGAWKAHAVAFVYLVQAVVTFAGVLAIVFGALWFKAPAEPLPAVKSDGRAFLERIVFIELLGIAGMVLLFKTNLRDRWLLPLLFFLPVLLVIWLRPRLSAAKCRLLRNGIMVAAAAVLIVLPAIPLLASITNRPTRLNAPYAALCRELKAQGYRPEVVAAATHLVGGNLKLFFPESTVVAPDYYDVPIPPNATWLLAWDATRRSEPPAGFIAMVARLRGVDLSTLPPQYLELACKYTNRKHMRLAYVVLKP